MIRHKLAVSTALNFFLAVPLCLAQTPGQNINMVSGTSFPTGDPYLQRQNEPSITASSRNSSHLLAVSNDYRSINIPAPPDVSDETRDAWLGVYKSFDGGATWQSNLLPGYPQDVSPEGLASPLHGFTTAADPVVRAGTNGMFYFSGISFDRANDNGVIFVARFIDLANKENGDPIAYLDTGVVDRGSSARFIDKPWIVTDIPRGTATCSIQTTQDGKPVSQTIPAGTVYVSYSAFIGGDDSADADILVSHSADCGRTWAKPIVISGSQNSDSKSTTSDNESSGATQVNQGSSMVIDPQTGAVYVAWRAFVHNNLPDAILVSKSDDGGMHFSKPVKVQVLPPFNFKDPTAPAFFDQPLTTSSFRSNGYPSLAIDGSGRLYLGWSQRGLAQGGDARIVVATSSDGVSWTAPQPIDNEPVSDDFGNTFERGEQFMPSLTFTEGKLMAFYYDQRLDHTVGEFTPNQPFIADPATGAFYKQARAFVGDLPGSPNLVFTPFIADFGLKIRHTLDVRVSEADPAPSPSFTSIYVSQYKFGTLGNEQPPGTVTHLQQLQLNPPNLPMFQGGTVPFIGDYIDITGRTFSPPGETKAGWQFNTAPNQSVVHFAAWTSDQDVRPPADFNWADYTPPGPGCIPGQEGDKNQNIYFSRITEGLAFSSPQISKPLKTDLQRAFVLDLFNGTKFPHTFRLTIANQPTDGLASFAVAPVPLPSVLPQPVTFVDLTLPPLSGATRSVFATSTNPSATIEVTATEIVSVGGKPKVNGLTGLLVLNSDITVPALVNPDSSPGNINLLELYTPNLSNPNLSNPNLSNPNLSNPNLSNPNLSNPNLSNPNLSNPNLSNPNLSNANVTNPDVANPNLSNPNLSNPNLSNASVSDITYSVTNNGNTNAGYQVRLVQLGNVPASAHIQLIFSKTYLTPIGDNCKLLEEPTNEIVANITNPMFIAPSQVNLNTSNATGTDNGTLHLAPGETAVVTIRGAVNLATMQMISENLVPAVRAGAAPSGTPGNLALPLTLVPATLNKATAGQVYSTTIVAIGGVAPYTFSVAPGSKLPPGFTLNATTGKLTNSNPAQNVAGTYTFSIRVTDSEHPAHVATRSYTLQVVTSAPLRLAFSSLPNGQVGQAYSYTLSAFGGSSPYVWTVTNGSLPSGLQLTQSGIIGGVPNTAGLFTFTLNVHDSGSPEQSASGVFSILVQNSLQITTTTLPDAQIGQYYYVPLQASGGTAPLIWSIVSGEIHYGLSLSSDGIISGIPGNQPSPQSQPSPGNQPKLGSQGNIGGPLHGFKPEWFGPGTFQFTVKVVDSGNPQQTATHTFTLVVLPAGDGYGTPTP